MKREMMWALVVSACLTACTTEESGDPSGSTTGTAGAPTTSSGGGGSTGGSGGSGGGGNGGAGGEDDPTSTGCDEFPAAVAMGTTDVPDFYAANLCFEDDGALDGQCHVVTVNTYTCPDPSNNHIALSKDPGGNHTLFVKPQSGGWVSSSHGTIGLNASLSVPTNVEITAVFETPVGEYTLVFSFDDAAHVTVNSFDAN